MSESEENMKTLGMAIHRAAEAEKAVKFFEEDKNWQDMQRDLTQIVLENSFEESSFEVLMNKELFLFLFDGHSYYHAYSLLKQRLITRFQRSRRVWS